MSVPTIVAQEITTAFGLRIIGQINDCRQQFFAITAERKLNHPAMSAITSKTRSALSG